MRIEKPNNGLYQAKIAQEQIEVVSSDLVTTNNNLIATSGILSGQITIVNNNLIAASSSLDAKIDSNLSSLRVRSLNSVSSTQFSTTSTATVYITGSATIYDKKYSDTELRVSVFVLVATDLSNAFDTNIANIAYSINGGSSWVAGPMIRASSPSSFSNVASLLHFNLGQLPSGNVDFRIGVAKTIGTNVYVRGFSYQFIEAMQNA